jgi:hypothetical protein
MTQRTLLLSAAAGLLISAASASADIYTPSSVHERSQDHVRKTTAAALGRQDTIIVVPDEEDYAHAKPTSCSCRSRIGRKSTPANGGSGYIIIGVAPLHSAGQVNTCCGTLYEFSQYNYAARIEHGATKHVDRDAWWTVEVNDNSIATRARNACRLKRKELEDQGLSRKQIFAQDRATTMPTDFRVARVGHRSHDLRRPAPRFSGSSRNRSGPTSA